MNAISKIPHSAPVAGLPPVPDVMLFSPQPAGNAPASRQETRILSLHFPWLATDRTWRGRLGARWRMAGEKRPPLIHAHKDRNAMRIAHMDETAAALGLRIGQGLADAKAIHPAIDIVPADEGADRRLLEALADWCDRVTPLVALDGTDGLFLDITGCAHLFGGEKALLCDLMNRFWRQGIGVRAAIAATAGAAWAAARFHAAGALIAGAGAEAALAGPFPLAALRLDTDTIAGLDKVGLKTVNQLMETPRAPLTRRFGRMVLMRLDQLLGDLEEALSPRLPVPALSVERRLAEPVGLTEDIEQLLYQLARSLKADLERRAAGARALEFTLFRVDGAVTRLCVGTSRPVRDPELVVRLFRERLTAIGDGFDAGHGFDLLRLNVLSDAPFDHAQADLAGDGPDAGEGVAALMDRIAARLGRDGLHGHPVQVPERRESHVPEEAERWVPLDAHKANVQGGDEGAPLAPRPVRLFVPPEPVDVVAGVPEGPPVRFRWRRALYEVRRAEGPERIAGEWWTDRAPEDLMPPPRDYYRVEDVEGRRFWLYRLGLYGTGPQSDAAPPRWFMHGLFA